MKIKKLFAFVIASCFIFTAAPSKARSRFSGIKKAIVIDFVDTTKRFNGSKVADRVRLEFQRQAPFQVLSKRQMLSKFKRLKISRRKMLRKSYRKAVAKYLGVDAVISGIIRPGKRSKYRLSLKMETVRTQKVVRMYTLPFNKYIGPKASKVVASRFLGKTKRRSLARRPAPSPTPGIEVPPDAQFDSLSQPGQTIEQRREMPKEDDVPDWVVGKEEEAPRKKAEFRTTGSKEKKESERFDESKKRDWLTLKFSPSFYKNSYKVTNPAGSAVVNVINISTSMYPSFNFWAEWWFLDFLGIDAFYNIGFLTLNVTPPGGTQFSVKTKSTQLGGGIKYRYHFLRDETRSPYASLRFGYTLQKFSPNTHTPATLSSNKYNDMMVGIGAKMPFWFLEKPDIGLTFGFDYFIWSKLKESGVNNGTSNSSSGWQVAFGPYWKFYKYFTAGLDIAYNKHSASFSSPDTSAGTRADIVDGAKSSDSFLGIMIALGVNF